MRPKASPQLFAALSLALLLPALVSDVAWAQRRTARERIRSSERWLEDCRDRWRGDDDYVRFCEERTMGWRSPGALLRADVGPNGGVDVQGWDRDSIHVVVRIQANARSDEEAREIARDVRAERRGDELIADGPGNLGRRRWWNVSFVVYAPRGTNLEIETVNGPIGVSDMVSRMDLRVQNGPLSLYAVGGDVTARAQNGPLSITLEGERWEGAKLDAATQNGPLVLEVPDGYNAELETGTINGPMSFGFPITVQGRIGVGSRRHITTTLGRGGPTIRAVTTNGPAVIRRS